VEATGAEKLQMAAREDHHLPYMPPPHRRFKPVFQAGSAGLPGCDKAPQA
jgi:hypothetical protein